MIKDHLFDQDVCWLKEFDEIQTERIACDELMVYLSVVTHAGVFDISIYTHISE